MKLTRSWLNDYINTPTTNQVLADKLTMAGLEVDAITPVCNQFTQVFVGKIVACDKHKNADKLKICQVNIGKQDNLQIICGAKNARIDLMVAVATIGAELAEFSIKKAKLRGVESFGMLCSASELGLNTDIFGNEGILELDEQSILGCDIQKALKLDDDIIELDITPNRGDCFSVLGVAREIAINENLTIQQFTAREATPLIQDTKNIHIQQTAACPRYLTRIIKGVDNTIPTPIWMRERLIYAGQKTHSLLVDITNYVLLELGQPLHAFDLTKIQGDISVDYSQGGEAINLLDGSQIELEANTLLIKDEHSILAIAGVMGGLESATTDKTTDILLESAFFDPVMIAGKARLYGLHTESSLRFERGVDFKGQQQAIQRATELIIQIAGGEVAPIVEKVSENELPKLVCIDLAYQSIKKQLGLELEVNWIEQQFKQLGFQIDAIDDKGMQITPPSFRFDIKLEVDLIEELARLYGYDKLPTELLVHHTNIKPQANQGIDLISGELVAKGYSEVINYSFISPKWHEQLYAKHKPLYLANPISLQMSIMRTGLLAGLLQTMINNQRYGQKEMRIFEVGLCFTGLDKHYQIQKIGGLISGNHPSHFSEPEKAVDFYDIKAIVLSLLNLNRTQFTLVNSQNSNLHPHQGADILIDDKKVGFFGALSPIIESKLQINKTFFFELDLSSILDKHIAIYQAFSTFQSMNRDISILIDEHLNFGKIRQSILALGQKFLIDLMVFDVYTDTSLEKGKKSLSLRLTYQGDRTMVDDEVDTLVKEVVQMLCDTYQAQQR